MLSLDPLLPNLRFHFRDTDSTFASCETLADQATFPPCSDTSVWTPRLKLCDFPPLSSGDSCYWLFLIEIPSCLPKRKFHFGKKISALVLKQASEISPKFCTKSELLVAHDIKGQNQKCSLLPEPLDLTGKIAFVRVCTVSQARLTQKDNIRISTAKILTCKFKINKAN